MEDPADDSELINGAFSAVGVADASALTETSDALTDYIRRQLDAATSGETTHTALRFSADGYYGCDTACDGDCSSKKVRFNAESLSLTITVSDSPAPTSEWAYLGSEGEMEYKRSAEPDTLGDTIPDFSGAGYLYGAAIPSFDEVGGQLVELTHESGDQTARIQSAIDDMERLPLDPSTGFRVRFSNRAVFLLQALQLVL